jgi:hypothetical protein
VHPPESVAPNSVICVASAVYVDGVGAPPSDAGHVVVSVTVVPENVREAALLRESLVDVPASVATTRCPTICTVPAAVSMTTVSWKVNDSPEGRVQVEAGPYSVNEVR